MHDFKCKTIRRLQSKHNNSQDLNFLETQSEYFAFSFGLFEITLT